MNETTQTEQAKLLSVDEESMYILVKRYLCRVLNVAVQDFEEKQFDTLISILSENGKVGAVRYLQSVFPMPDKQWIYSGYINNKFESFIKTDYPHIKPQQNKVSELGLKEAEDIVDWIEANRQYTQY